MIVMGESLNKILTDIFESNLVSDGVENGDVERNKGMSRRKTVSLNYSLNNF
jgi:hypothetical protein